MTLVLFLNGLDDFQALLWSVRQEGYQVTSL